MKAWIILLALAWANVVGAQTMTPRAGGAYDAFVASTIDCLGAMHGDMAAQGACLSDAVNRCMARAGVYEACLSAISVALKAAQARVLAETCDPLDPACRMLARGRILILMGASMDADGWRDALLEEN